NFSQAPEEYSKRVEEFYLSKYLPLLKEAKKELSIPVIASICCKTNENWQNYAERFVAAGADAIEINYYPVTSDASVTSSEIDKEFEKFVKFARKTISCPVSIKMGSKYTDMAHKIKYLDDQNINGVVLFNKTFRPNVNINTMTISNGSAISAGTEYTNSLRWTALMAGEVKMDICANTGIHSAETVIKMLLAGAKAVEVCSVIMKNGYEVIGKMNEEILAWMEAKQFSSVSDFCGKLAQEKNAEGYKWERTQFLNLIGGDN
ncbi:MAG: dihydroorotate oxidase, partial [Spirochaetales bacterium]|nr:dihydroorotate oxidase [Candidatus Physcosoma equi]